MTDEVAVPGAELGREAESSGKSRRARVRWLVWLPLWLLMLSPSLLYVLHLPQFAQVPHNDYYVVLSQLAGEDGLKLDPWTLLRVKSNEHTVTFPALAYALNIALTDGDNRGLSSIALVLLLAAFIPLYKLVPEDLRRSKAAMLLVGLPLGMLVFTPVAAHNVALGFSGTMWFMSNALALWAIWFLVRRSQRVDDGPWGLWPVSLLGLMGAFSYSTNLSLWPALLLGGLLLGVHWRRLLLPASTAVLVFLIYALTYEAPGHHPELETTNLSLLLRFLGVYLGSLFNEDPEIAIWLGWLGLGLSLTFYASVLTDRGDDMKRLAAPWLMVSVLALGNALGTASARSGFGLEVATAFRYASIQSLFWIGLLVPSGILLWRGRSRLRPIQVAQLGLPLLLCAFFFLSMYQRGGPFLLDLIKVARAQPYAAIALKYGVNDVQALHCITRFAPDVWKVMEFLERTGHVPFALPSAVSPGLRIEPELIGQRVRPQRVRGYLDALQPVSDNLGARVTGWAFSSWKPIEAIIFLNQAGEVVGEAELGYPRPDVAKSIDPRAENGGFRGFVRASSRTDRIRAYARLTGEARFRPLHGIKSLPPEPPLARPDAPSAR